MNPDKLLSVGRELGYARIELREWVEKEIVRQKEERVRMREDAREAAKEAQETADREAHRFQQEQAVLQMRLQLRGNNSSPRDEDPQDTGSGENLGKQTCYRSPHKLIPPF